MSLSKNACRAAVLDVSSYSSRCRYGGGMVHAVTTEGHYNLAVEEACADAALHSLQDATHAGGRHGGRCKRYAWFVLRRPAHCGSCASRAALRPLWRSESGATSLQQLQRHLLLRPALSVVQLERSSTHMLRDPNGGGARRRVTSPKARNPLSRGGARFASLPHHGK